MLLSVIICGYNRQEFIENALNSVLNQTMDKASFEIIINTNYEVYDIEKLLASGGYNYTILRGGDEPLGLYYARAIESSNGEIISFLDDDDEFAPDKLNYIVNTFQKYPELVFINNDVKIIDSLGILISQMERDFRFNSGRKGDILLDSKNKGLSYKAIRKHGNFCNSSMSIKRVEIEKHSEYLKSISGAEDDFLFFTALFSGGKLLISGEKMTYYRIHNKNKSTYAKIKLDEALKRMQIEMPKAIHSLESANLAIHPYEGSESYRCYNGIYTSYEILQLFSSIQFKRRKMLRLMIKYLKTNPWRLSSAQRMVLAISIISLISISLSRNLYKLLGLGK